MPIPIEEFATPQLIKMQTKYPMSYNKDDRFNEVNPRLSANRHMGAEGREGGWKFAGYNPNHQSTRIEKFSIRNDDITLKPY
jgi:hypothetical protein